jgi:hypothetical protein
MLPIHFSHPLVSGGEPGYLIGTVTIAGVDFHAEAVRVRDEQDGDALLQVAADRGLNESILDRLHELGGPDAFSTISIPGFPGSYVLWITPFCE